MESKVASECSVSAGIEQTTLGAIYSAQNISLIYDRFLRNDFYFVHSFWFDSSIEFNIIDDVRLLIRILGDAKTQT